MRIGGRPQIALKGAVWVGAVITAPLLLVVGGPAYERFMRHLCREGGRGLIDKRAGWVHPGYWVVMNPFVRVLTWPTRSDGPLRSRANR